MKKKLGVIVSILFLIVLPVRPVLATYTHEVTSNSIKIEAENYNTGGQNVGYYDIDAQNLSGAYRQDGVDIKSISGGYVVSYSRPTEWLQFTFPVNSQGNYSLSFRVASPVSDGKIKVTLDGQQKGTFTVPNTGSFDTFRTVTFLSSVSLSQGQHTLRIENTGGKYDTDWVSFTKVNATGTPTPSVAPSPSVTPLPTLSPIPEPSSPPQNIPSSAVRIKPTDDAAAIVNSKPSGTVFYFEAGTHRLKSSLKPKGNMKLVGQKGAILSGSKLLTSFTKEGNLWVATNQTQESAAKPSSTQVPTSSSSTGSICAPGYTRCNRNEQLFINDTVLKHVDAKSKVTPGSWYFDYGANKIYFADNPSGKKVETSVIDHAVIQWSTSHNNIVVRNLIIEKFATPAQRSAVELRSNSNTLEYSEVRHNHGGGGFDR